jgi:hypothetical protein
MEVMPATVPGVGVVPDVDAGPDASGSKVAASPSGAASSPAESPPIPAALPLVKPIHAPR